LIARLFPVFVINPHPGNTLMTGKRMWQLLLAVAGVFAALAGCHKDVATENTNTAGPPRMSAGMPAAGKVFDADSEPHAAGKKVMVSSGCFRCHAVDGAKPAGGAPGPGGPGGPPQAGRFGPGGPGGPGGGPTGGPGRGRMGAPDLAKVGADPEHTPDWLSQYILKPTSVKPDSKGMPAFEGKMSEDDLKALVEYLASLK
jgi:cytochrome c5